MANRDSCRLALIMLMACCVSAGALAQPTIPPPHVPPTEEPPLARPGELPKLRPDVYEPIPAPRRLGNQPAAWNVPGGAAEPSLLATPTVAIVVNAPGSIKVGEPIVYTITVENRSNASAHHVVVSNPVPKNATFVKANPEPAEKSESHLHWRFGTMEPRARQVIELTLRPTGDGDVTNIARVHFEHGEQVVTRVRGPQLNLRKIAAGHAYENEAIPCRLIVENSGVVALNNIVVKETVDDGLEHEGNERGSAAERTWNIGALQPGEKREVTYSLIAKKAGTFSSTAIASDGKVRSETKWSVTIGKSQVDVKLTGPDRAYSGQPATYQAVVKNTGSIPLDNVAVVYHLPAGCRVVRASQDAESFQVRVQWNVARLEAGGTRTFRFDVAASKAGLVEHKVEALAKGSQSKASVVTDFLGAIGLRLHVYDSAEPGRKGAAITYTLRLYNTGSTTAENVVLKIDYPILLMSFDRASVPHKMDKDKNRIVLDPVTVHGRDSVTITVTMQAQAPGIARFHVEMSGADLDPSRPVIVEESTTIMD